MSWRRCNTDNCVFYYRKYSEAQFWFARKVRVQINSIIAARRNQMVSSGGASSAYLFLAYKKRQNNNRDRNVLKQKGECATDAAAATTTTVSAAAACSSLQIVSSTIHTKKKEWIYTRACIYVWRYRWVLCVNVLVRLQSIDHPYPGSVTDDSDEETLKMESKK